MPGTVVPSGPPPPPGSEAPVSESEPGPGPRVRHGSPAAGAPRGGGSSQYEGWSTTAYRGGFLKRIIRHPRVGSNDPK
eukprot:752716-Hanusia_phi.AAC.1